MVSLMGLDLPPVSWQRWMLLALTIAFCIQAFLAVDRHCPLCFR
jgi:hypothetical protein